MRWMRSGGLIGLLLIFAGQLAAQETDYFVNAQGQAPHTIIQLGILSDSDFSQDKYSWFNHSGCISLENVKSVRPAPNREEQKEPGIYISVVYGLPLIPSENWVREVRWQDPPSDIATLDPIPHFVNANWCQRNDDTVVCFRNMKHYRRKSCAELLDSVASELKQ